MTTLEITELRLAREAATRANENLAKLQQTCDHKFQNGTTMLQHNRCVICDLYVPQPNLDKPDPDKRSHRYEETY